MFHKTTLAVEQNPNCIVYTISCYHVSVGELFCDVEVRLSIRSCVRLKYPSIAAIRLFALLLPLADINTVKLELLKPQNCPRGGFKLQRNDHHVRRKLFYKRVVRVIIITVIALLLSFLAVRSIYRRFDFWPVCAYCVFPVMTSWGRCCDSTKVSSLQSIEITDHTRRCHVRRGWS